MTGTTPITSRSRSGRWPRWSTRPSVRPSRPSGYPVTHYVGVAGVGEDAAQLPANDPRAGVFGYGRQTRPAGPPSRRREHDRRAGRAGPMRPLGPRRPGDRPSFDPAAICQRAGRIRQRPGRRHGGRHGRRLGAFPLEGHRSARHGATGDGPRRRAGRCGRARAETAGSGCGEPTAGPRLPSRRRSPTSNRRRVDVKPPAAVGSQVAGECSTRRSRSSRFPTCRWPRRCNSSRRSARCRSASTPTPWRNWAFRCTIPISIEVANTTAGKTLKEIAAKRNMTPVIENGQVLLTSPAEHREGLQTMPVLSLRPDRRRRPSRGRFGRPCAKARRARVVAGRRRARDRGGNARRPADHADRASPSPDHRLLREAPRRPRPADEEPSGPEEVRPDHADRAGEGHSGPDGERERERAVAAFEHPRAVQAARGKQDPHRPSRAGGGRDFGEHHRQVQGRQAAAGRGLGTAGTARLAWRAVDANTLLVTTQKAVAARMELEFYPVGKLLAGQPPAALIERIKPEAPRHRVGRRRRRDRLRSALAMLDRVAIATGAKAIEALLAK